MKIKYHLSIDPGVDGTGVAIWPAAGWTKDPTPEKAMVFSPSTYKGKSPWQVRCDSICDQLDEGLSHYGSEVGNVFLEYPAVMGGEGGTRAARSGNVVKLAYLTGRIHEVLRWGLDANIVPVEVGRWKGQTSKEKVIGHLKRIVPSESRKYAGMTDPPSHDWDAVGIGLWAKGLY